jgi:hypothetical protein
MVVTLGYIAGVASTPATWVAMTSEALIRPGFKSNDLTSPALDTVSNTTPGMTGHTIKKV